MPSKKFDTRSKRRQIPTTPSDFFDAAIEYEEAGDRWSTGDGEKALRFWQRAADAYQTSLNLAEGFDAAYNLARLRFRIAEAAAAEVKAGSGTDWDWEGVLQAHYRALELVGEGGGREDVLFNTAQVHTALADALLEERGADRERAAVHLLKAKSIFEECLHRQRKIFESYSNPMLVDGMGKGDEDEDMDMDMDTGGVQLVEERREEKEEYAVVQEPLTEGVIADTLVELLKTLSTLLPLLADPREAVVSGEELLQQLYILHSSLPDRQTELCIASAITRTAIAESSHRFSLSASTVSSWESTITDAFSHTWPWSQSPGALCAKSDCHISLASAVPTAAWRHYSFASRALAAAAALEGGKTARIHVARGDTELLRSRTEGCTPEIRAVLRRNAGVFYRGAIKLAGAKDGAVKREAEVKELAVRIEDGAVGAGEIQDGDTRAREVLEEAAEEGVFLPGIWEVVTGQQMEAIYTAGGTV